MAEELFLPKEAARRIDKIMRAGGQRAADVLGELAERGRGNLPEGVSAALRHRPGYLPEQEGARALRNLLESKQRMGATPHALDYTLSRLHPLGGSLRDMPELTPTTSAAALQEMFESAASVPVARAALTHPNASEGMLAWGEQLHPDFSQVHLNPKGGVPGTMEAPVEMAKLTDPSAFIDKPNAKPRNATNPVQHTKAWADVGEINLEGISPDLERRIREVGLPARNTMAFENLDMDLKSIRRGSLSEKNVRKNLLPKSKQEIMADRRVARAALPEYADAMHPRSTEEAMAAHRAAVDARTRAHQEEFPAAKEFGAGMAAQRFKEYEQRHGTAKAREIMKNTIADLEEDGYARYMDPALLERMRASSHPADVPRPAPVAPVAAPSPEVPATPAPASTSTPAAAPTPTNSSGSGIPLAVGAGALGLAGLATYGAMRKKPEEEEKKADLAGSRPMAYSPLPKAKKPMDIPVLKQAHLDLTGKEAPEAPGVKLADTHFALGTRYPITAPSQVKLACEYFEEHAAAFPPLERREFAYNLCKRASELGFSEWLGETARTYGGEPTQDLDTIKRAFHARQEFLPIADEAAYDRGLRMLDMLEPKLAHLSPAQRVTALETIDAAYGLDRLYSRGLLQDPHEALTEKWAEPATFSEVVDGITVLEDDLLHLATKREFLKENFSEEVVDKMQKSPVATFKGLSGPLKTLMARCAKAAAG